MPAMLYRPAASEFDANVVSFTTTLAPWIVVVVPSSRTVPLIDGPGAGVGATPLAEIGEVFVPLV
jgi:hypothetical protein